MLSAPASLRRFKLLVELLRHAAQGGQSGKHLGEFDAHVIIAFHGSAVECFAQKYSIAELDFHGCAGWHGLGTDEPQAAARGILNYRGQEPLRLAENGQANELFSWDAMFTPMFHEKHIGGKWEK